jgi:tol-pal system protein YbgF
MFRFLAATVAASVSISLVGCAAQSGSRAKLENENHELRRLLLETRRDLEEVRRDQDRLRDSVEYLQYSQGGSSTGAPSKTGGTSEWPEDPWSSSSGYGATGSASAYDSLASSQPVQPSSRGSVNAPLIYNDPSNPSRVPQPSTPKPGESRIVMGVRDGGSWTEPGKVGVATPPPSVPSKLRGTGYDDGVRSFSDGHYEDAIQYFRDFIHKNPQSSYADDAQYWIGECYLRKELYSNAIKEFNQVVLRHGSGDRSAAALLKLAEVFSKIGDQVDARLSLQKLVNRYPGSSEAAEAYRLLKEMGS